MTVKHLMFIALVCAIPLSAETKKEKSLFLEYEREVAKQNDPQLEEANPFKKIITILTPSNPATPFVHTPVVPPKPVVVQNESPTIGQDSLPYLIISKQPQKPEICPLPDAPKSIAKYDKKPSSLFENIESSKQKIMDRAREFLGTSYGFGSKEATQTDCSGFTQQVFQKFGINLPRSAAQQANYGTYVDSNDLQVGDLLFYQTYKSEPSHVAIYAGDGQIIHASYRNKRVQYDAIDKGYYKQRFMYAKRLALQTQNASDD